MASRSGPRVTAPHNLALCLDAGNIKSYDSIKSPTTVNSLVGNITSSSYNSNITYETSDGGSWKFSGNSTTPGIKFNSITSFMPLGTNDMTYEMWAKPSGVLQSPFALNRTTSSNTDITVFGILFAMSGYDGIVVYSPVSGNFDTGGAFSFDWQHFVFTHDISAGVVKVYRNNVLIKTNTDTTNWSSYPNNNSDTYSFMIGYGGGINAGATYGGNISIFRIYKGKAFTAEEVSNNYETFKHRFGI